MRQTHTTQKIYLFVYHATKAAQQNTNIQNIKSMHPVMSQTRMTLHFYSAAALIATQSAVLATAIPSVRLSVCLSHAGTLSRRMKVGSCGLHDEVAKTL